jgi:glycosyltransferase, group 1 family protein
MKENKGFINIMDSSVWGGMEQYVYDMSEELQRQDVVPYVLVDMENSEFVDKYSEVATVLPIKLSKNSRYLYANKVANFMREHNIDTILCHTGKFILFALLLKKLTNAKLLFFKHNVIPAKTDVYHRWIQNQVDGFVCVSKCVYDAQVVKGKEHKYYLIYNGINTHRFPNKIVNKKENTFVVGFASRIGEDKGIIELFEAIKYLYDSGKSIELYICGDTSEHSKGIANKYIHDYNMTSYVTNFGFQKDMNQFYRSIDCLLAPSKIKEAFGLVICEAMYCQVPVITSCSGAQKEIITHGEDGLLIDTVDSKTIAQSIEYLMDNPSIYENIKNNGYNRVLSMFTIKKMVRDIIDL